jgi:oligopeptide/dipeptide ABC transporter ATP-binding protein
VELPDVADTEPPDAANLPAGCRFHPRCPLAVDICREVEPELRGPADRMAACHLAEFDTGEAE